MPYLNTIQILHLKSSSRGKITWDQLSERNKNDGAFSRLLDI